jgi:DNA repair protein RadC
MKDASSRRSIKAWPRNERPRERLLLRGPAAVSDAELLAILIRSGSGNANALDLARSILTEAGNLRRVAARSAEEFARGQGMGWAKAVTLVAAFELGRRAEREIPDDETIIRSPEDVAALMIPRLRDATCEKFHVLVLDSKNGMIRNIELTSGTLNASLVHPREVFKTAIDHRAASVIVVHNHPSGNREPSREDIEITRQLAETGRIVGIPLHDHIIIAGNSFTSLAERGLC